jgi:hypothetical protein
VSDYRQDKQSLKRLPESMLKVARAAKASLKRKGETRLSKVAKAASKKDAKRSEAAYESLSEGSAGGVTFSRIRGGGQSSFEAFV